MKKRLILVLSLALLLTLSFSSVAFAADPTEVDVNWSGSGGVWADVDTGDAEAGFITGGDVINGSYSTKDSNDNPYGYGVDSFSALFTGSVENGFMTTDCLRTDSTGMYGVDGQYSFSGVEVWDGSASMAYRSTTNFAQMTDATYGNQLLGGHNIVVNNAAAYYMERWIDDGRGNRGYLEASGDGNATLDCMSAGASGCWTLQFGRGAGCYTDASFSATGTSGHFEASGTGNNNVTFHGLGVSSGGGTLAFVADWTNNFSIADYSLSAN